MADPLLMIEDDESLARMVAEYLRPHGFELLACASGTEGLARLRALSPVAVILDVMLPDLDGFEVCRRIRAFSQVPVVMLTARGEETDRNVGLEIGADDYLPKPFNPRELLARLLAVLRRRTPLPPDVRQPPLRFGRLEIDQGARVVSVDGVPKALTAYQFELLLTLAQSAGRVLSREALMERVRGDTLEAFDRSIDVHVSRIRAALEDDPKRPRRILTVRGAGYVFAKRQDQD
jgi:two-component system phosphate regulon response regulator OmpR